MPRQPRIDLPGAAYHVMARGIEKREIFRDDHDRSDFLNRLAHLLPDEGITCFAWTLMTNHVHLVVRTGPRSSISRLMARLGTGYAARFNRRHVRVGHLFQNRFRSDLVADEKHLSTLLRYVHLNPVRAGLIGSILELAAYPWTGHAALMGRSACSFLAVREVLSWFGPNNRSARLGLRRWMEDGRSATGPDLEVPSDGPPPIPRPANSTHTPGSTIEYEGWDLTLLLAWACAQTGAAEAQVRSGRRMAAVSDTRAIAAYLAHSALGLRAVEIATTLRLGSGSASRAITRGQALSAQLRLALPLRPESAALDASSPEKQKSRNVPG